MLLTQNYWNEMPAVRWLLAMLLGIAAAVALLVYDCFTDFYTKISISILLIGAVGLVFFLFIKKPTIYYKYNWLKGFLFFILLFAVGFCNTWLHTQIFYQHHFSKQIINDSSQVVFVARINDPPVFKEKTVVAEVVVKNIIANKTAKATTGKVLINFSIDSLSQSLKYGDIIYFSDVPQLIEPPKNPQEFDYKSYQQFHNINHRLYLKNGFWQKTNQNDGNFLLKKIYAFRNYLLQLILVSVPGKNERAVASAIILGYRDYMNADVVQAYSSSGAMHVLSVSGLHVGVVFMMLNLLLGWLDKTHRGRIFKAIIIIGFIGFYSIITGLSPSVLRAFVMFSILTISKVLYRNNNTYNVLAASCFLLLLYNPFLITEVGFRLSYLAVLGIVFLYPRIYALLSFQNWLIDKAWGITSVSIAAQVATFPLSLLYFHQFPNLFLVSNLIVIPVSNLVLFGSILLFIVSPIPVLFHWVGKLFNGLLIVLNKIVFWFDSQPYAITEGISISHIEMTLWYLLIFVACWYWVEQRKGLLQLSFALVLLLCGFYIHNKIINLQKNEFVIYSAKNKSGWMLKEGSKVVYKMDSDLIYNKSAFLFHIQHHWWEDGIAQARDIDSVPQNKIAIKTDLPFGYLVQFRKHKILFINSDFGKLENNFSKKMVVDYVVLENSPKIYLSELQKAVSFKKIIFDASAREWRKKYWIKDCEDYQLSYIDVAKGAYIETW